MNIRWKGRRGIALENGQLQVVILPGGGHIASLRLTGSEKPNVLWEAPWATIEPHRFSGRKDERKYGPEMVGRFLAGYTGHAICLDYFGAPSAREMESGLPLHGEIASQPWRVLEARKQASSTVLRMDVRAPRSQLRFERDVRVLAGESVVYFRERLTNLRNTGRPYQWVEHVTFGPPLLERGESVVAMPAVQARSWPLGYEGKALLADDRASHWPEAFNPAGAAIDVSKPFVKEGTGFVLAALLDRAREYGFVAALNWRLGLLAGYLFRRGDFPWVAIWEENRARAYSPWNGETRCRGLEFGNTPMPLGLAAAVQHGPILGEAAVGWLDARASREGGYVAFICEVPRSWRGVGEVTPQRQEIVIRGLMAGQEIRLRARGLRQVGLLSSKAKTTER